jgi:NAD(P)-dependent dehydrogenase (short-subunit alcohol dehydrogenase family)
LSVKELFSLEHKIAVVTGGAGHLGTALSQALAQAGARVVVAGRNKDNCEALAIHLTEKFGKKSWGMQLDIRKIESVKSLVDQALDQAGGLDILVNNAAFYSGSQLETMCEEEWLQGLDGTANHVFRFTNAVIPTMKRVGGGSIINISSMYGMVSPDPNVYRDSCLGNPPNYGAGKAAVLQFTRYAACYLGRYGIRINAISPGPFPNPDVQDNHPWFIDELASKTPLGRIGQPSELMGAIVFLASEASSYVTGANLVVDGGWTAW